MARWDEKFPISDGNRTTEEDALPVYRSYAEDCDIEMTLDVFNELSRLYKMYIATTALKNISFTPKDVLPQDTTNYHFMHLQVKFKRFK